MHSSTDGRSPFPFSFQTILWKPNQFSWTKDLQRPACPSQVFVSINLSGPSYNKYLWVYSFDTPILRLSFLIISINWILYFYSGILAATDCSTPAVRPLGTCCLWSICKYFHSWALAKRYSQLKPTRAKLQNQNLHRQVAKRYCQVEPARKKTIHLSDHNRVLT